MTTLPFDAYLESELASLRQLDRLREPDDGRLRAAAEGVAAAAGVAVIDASSNDYLGFSRGVVSRETAVQVGRAPTGAGASRLIHGTRDAHLALEAELASWVGLPSALLFTSGFAANIGLLSALATPDTVVLSDQLNHASIIDGCRQARARTEVIPHLNLDGYERALSAHGGAKARFVVIESFFSMDGDVSDLRALRSLCDRHAAALLVDEAHALGVFGPHGAGRCAEFGVVPDALMGTLGKSVGAQGAFVAGSPALRTLLWNRARSFVFSTAGSPLLAEVARFHVQRTRAADSERQQLHDHVARLRAALAARNLQPVPGSVGPIVPLVVGSNKRSLAVAATLSKRGILTQAIRPPTVPEGTARIRLTVNAAWPADGAERIADAVAEALTQTQHEAMTRPPRSPAAPAAAPGDTEPRRVVLLGTGTGIGKTWTSLALTRALVRRGAATLALKPIESGVPDDFGPGDSDAELLARASSATPTAPPYRLPDPISPHLAASRAGITLDLGVALRYVQSCESSSPEFVLVESAGGVFSPLAPGVTNFELARALDPAFWVLCAPDALGVLHQLTATLEAMRARGREPDCVVLSAPADPDASTGTNATELATLGITRPLAVLGRNRESDISPLADALLARSKHLAGEFEQEDRR